MRFIVLILTALILISNVEALAVASDYLEDNTLQLIEGTSTIYSIRLQNTGSDETRVKIDYDGTLMKAIDFKEEYTLPPKSSTRIEFNVTAPEYKKNSNVFTLSLTAHQTAVGGASGIGFLPKINKNFKLEVLKNPDRFYIDPLYMVYAAIVLAFLGLVHRKKIIDLWKRRNQTFKNQKFLGSRKFNEFSRISKNRFKSRKIIKW